MKKVTVMVAHMAKSEKITLRKMYLCIAKRCEALRAFYDAQSRVDSKPQ